MGKNIDGITRTASALTGTERFPLRDGVANPAGDLDAKGTISQLVPYVFGEIDSLTEQTALEDTNLFALLDGTTPKYSSFTTLATYVQNLIATQRRGTIQLWGAAAAPTGALLCTGQAVSRTTYASLFAIIGTTFGVGDNSTTFNVPNFKGVVPKGVGSQTINTRSKTMSALGALQEDQGQGHQVRINRYDSDVYLAGGSVQSGGGATVAVQTAGVAPTSGNVYVGKTLISDGTNGTPRTGATTQENCLGINFIVWY